MQEQDRKKDYERMLEHVKDDKSTHLSRHRNQLQEVGCKRIALVRAPAETLDRGGEGAFGEIQKLKCPYCGIYRMYSEAKQGYPNIEDSMRLALSSAARWRIPGRSPRTACGRRHG